MYRFRCLIVDDDPGVAAAMSAFLRAHEVETDVATGRGDALACFARRAPDVVILDYRLGETDALALLPALLDIDDTLPVVVLTGYGSIELAVQAIKLGAENFLTKPVEMKVLLIMLERLVDARRLRRRQLAQAGATGAPGADPFRGDSPAIRQLEATARKLLAVKSPVLLLGESGTGKTMLARWLHEHSERRDAMFVTVNCAAIPRDLLEAELFGHAKGAFSGATRSKPGLFELAHGGTLLLDEVGDMDLAL